MKQVDWQFMGRQALLVLAFAYVLLLGGGFPALVEFELQLFSTVLAALMLGSWLAWRALQREPLPYSGIELGLLLFVSAQVIATVFSEDVRRSLPAVVTWFTYALVFFFALDLLRRGWPAKLFATSLLIAGGIGLAFALVELARLYGAWTSIAAGVELAPAFQQRLTGIVGDPNLLAATTNLLIPIALALMLQAKPAGKIALGAFIAAALAVFFFTDSRGGLLGLGSSLGVFVLLWVTIVSDVARQRVMAAWQYLWQRNVLLAMLAIASTGAMAWFAWQQLSFEGDTTHGPVLSARDLYWEAATNALTEDPLTGAGPNMYPVQLMKIWSTPPARPYLHAHSFPFQVAAETGLLGLVGLAVLVGLVAWQAKDAWRGLDAEQRGLWTAAAAALVGLSVHSLVDDFFPFPAAGILAMGLLATVLQKPAGANRGFQAAWLVAPGLAGLAFTVFALNAGAHADRAVEAGTAGDWQSAVVDMQAAAEADPGFAFYWLQLGYVHGRAGDYDAAIAAYERGIELEPVYALNYANLGILYWSDGLRDLAHGELESAAGLAPESWLIAYNLGLLEEELSMYSTDDQLFRALSLEPDIAGAAVWRTTRARERALEAFESTGGGREGEASGIPELALQHVDKARQFIEEGDLGSAAAELESAHALNDQSVLLYVALAELAVANGDYDLAENYVDAALWVQAVSNHEKVEAVLLAAEIAAARGDAVTAMQRYETAYRGIMGQTSYGWGAAGWSPYAWFVFQRRAFPVDLLSMMARADISIDIAQRLLVLADLYEDAGLPDDAAAVQEALAEYLR